MYSKTDLVVCEYPFQQDENEGNVSLRQVCSSCEEGVSRC